MEEKDIGTLAAEKVRLRSRFFSSDSVSPSASMESFSPKIYPRAFSISSHI